MVVQSLILLAQEEAEHHTPNPLLPATEELIWGAVAFLLLFFLLQRFAFPVITRTMEDRAHAIQSRLETAEKERQEADRLLARYKERLAEAEAQAQQIVAEARANADRLKQELTARAQEEADRIIARGREELRRERDQAVRALRGEVATLAVELATKVIGDSLDRERQLRLIDQYINELSPEAAGTAGAAGPSGNASRRERGTS